MSSRLVPMSISELEKKQRREYKGFLKEQVEIEACSQSCLYFLSKYGKVKDKNRGIIPWEPWKHLILYLDCLTRHRFIIVLKSKQIGATWSMAGANLHLAQFQEGANILTLSKGENEASESLDYSRFIHDQLPDFLRLQIDKNQSSLLSFPSMYSKIRALPSTEDAGVGFGGASRVVMDEFEYHRYDKKNFSEILPPILEGGQLVIQSTADKLKAGTLFKELYTAARHGDNNFYPLFFPYDVLPGRDIKWYEDLSRTGLKDWEIECRYPRNEDEALKTLKSAAFFDENALYQLLMDCDIKPMVVNDIDLHGDIIRVFKPSVIGERYVVFTDPSDGKEDPFHTVVIKRTTGEGVCEAHGKLPADEVARIHDILVRYYNSAWNSYEMNAFAGGKFDEVIERLGTPNVVARRDVEGKVMRGKKAFYTTAPIKKLILSSLEEAVRKHLITVHSRDTVNEFSGLMRIEGEDMPRVADGAHDDCIMAWAGVWQTAKYVPISDFVITSGRYKG